MTRSKRFARPAALLGVAALALVACGGTAPPPEPPAEVEAPVEEAPAVVVEEPEPETIVMVVTATPDPAAEVAPAPEEQPTSAPVVESEPAGEAAPAVERVSRNEAWTPQTEQFEGVQFAMVPPGCFMMGTANASPAEKPVHEICFDQSFWIGTTEVNNDQFGSDGSYSGDDFPRNNVTWFDARNFCESVGGRLPTEAEWEYAARGPNGYAYPYGDIFQPGFVIFVDNALGAAPVASLRQGASWVGAFDMAGNVREWTSSAYADYPYNASDGREDPTASGDPRRVVRGGSYLSGGSTLRLTNREWYDWEFSTADIGFRCVRDAS